MVHSLYFNVCSNLWQNVRSFPFSACEGKDEGYLTLDLKDIDVLVAEKVMGWHKGPISWLDSAGEDTGWDHSVYGSEPDFRPSEDIAAAWQVWEKLRVDGAPDGDYFCCMDIRSPVGEGYEIVLRRGRHDEDHGKPFVLLSLIKTAPLAICLAALKAHGIDPEETT